MAPDGRWGVVLDSMYSWHADCAGIRLTSRVPPPTDGLRLRSGHRRVHGGRVATLAAVVERTPAWPAGRVRQRQLETGNGRQQEVNTGQAESVRVCGVAC